MGRDKSLVLWQGVPLLRRVYDVAAAVVGEVSIMTPWGDRYQEILPPGYHWFADEQPGEGPLVALQQVLRESNPAEVDWIWLLGCDLPSLNPEILQRWLENLENSTPEDLVARRAIAPRLGTPLWLLPPPSLTSITKLYCPGRAIVPKLAGSGSPCTNPVRKSRRGDAL